MYIALALMLATLAFLGLRPELKKVRALRSEHRRLQQRTRRMYPRQ